MELTTIVNESLAFINGCALKCAVELGIFGHIQAYGRPMPLNELARSIPIPPEKDLMLVRLMALLVQKEFLAQNEEGYMLTPVSNLMVTEGSNMGAYVRVCTELQVVKHMWDISKWYKDNGRDTAFEMANDGKQFWDMTMETPQMGKVFDEAMASQSTQVVKDLVARYPQIFDGLNSLVDVGGSTGITVKIIADAFPKLQCTVLDLPHVVAKALKDDSFNVVGGDMFEKIPPADAILLKNVIHNWGDDDCVRILKRCKEAIEPRKDCSKVIVVDSVLDHDDVNPKAIETSFLFDMLMMCTYGSKERRKQEWHDLIMGAGYSGYKIYPARLGVDSVLELYP